MLPFTTAAALLVHPTREVPHFHDLDVEIPQAIEEVTKSGSWMGGCGWKDIGSTKEGGDRSLARIR